MRKLHKICRRCIMDSSVSGITFDATGICNFCYVHDTLDKQYPLGKEGNHQLASIVQNIKQRGKGKQYDCVVGISGGRDSSYSLYLAKHIWKLRPLAVHFNDGFGNPVAGENMIRITRALRVPMRTITSDWRESKDLKLAFLEASTPDVEEGTDVGLATALYGVATKESVSTIIIGHSFRTEGIYPLSWNYLDGSYLLNIHGLFGKIPLRPWKTDDPGFRLGLRQLFYYTVMKRIRIIPILNYHRYIRADADSLLAQRFRWVNPGAHYLDDLYQSLVSYLVRKKFGIDRRITHYAALVRSGQMERDEALRKLKTHYVLEDPTIIALCLKRLGLSKGEFRRMLSLPPKTFRDYPTLYCWIKTFRFPIKLLTHIGLLPPTIYEKYFHCG